MKLLMGGLAVIMVLAVGIYVYACGACKTDENIGSEVAASADEHKGHKHGDEAKEQPAEDTPEGLLKTADKLLKEAAKTKDVKPLMVHCEKMISASLKMVSECNSTLSSDSPDMDAVAKNTETVTKLMKKSVECLSLVPKADKKSSGEEKAMYVCPMGCIEPTDKPGKCPKCGMNLEKKK